MRVKHGMSKTPTYKTWEMMIQRCCNPNFDGYVYYGGRGIQVCDDWKSFVKFWKDMGTRPEGTSLDRIDVDGNYSPENCRWTNQSEQSYGTRPRKGSKRTGVYFHKASEKWTAQIYKNGINMHLGLFLTFEDAVSARESAEMELWGKLKYNGVYTTAENVEDIS